MREHDWAAVIGGTAAVAYCCQACGLQLPGQILLVSPHDEAWLQAWISRPENAPAEVHRVDIPRGAAYLADPREVELRPCSGVTAPVEPWFPAALARHELLHSEIAARYARGDALPRRINLA